MQRELCKEEVGVDVKHPDPAAREHNRVQAQDLREHGRVQLLKKARRSQCLCPVMAARTSLRKTMKFWLLDLVRMGHTHPRRYPWSLPEGC